MKNTHINEPLYKVMLVDDGLAFEQWQTIIDESVYWLPLQWEIDPKINILQIQNFIIYSNENLHIYIVRLQIIIYFNSTAK